MKKYGIVGAISSTVRVGLRLSSCLSLVWGTKAPADLKACAAPECHVEGGDRPSSYIVFGKTNRTSVQPARIRFIDSVKHNVLSGQGLEMRAVNGCL